MIKVNNGAMFLFVESQKYYSKRGFMRKYFQISILLSIALIGMLLINAELFARPEIKTYVGTVSQENDGIRYRILCNFGIEQYENGKKSDTRYQQWLFSGSNYIAGKHETYLTVERIVFDKWSSREVGTQASYWVHSINDNTLVIKALDWEKGIVDFSLVFTDGSTAEVMMRIKRDKDSLFLEQFKAYGIARGYLSDTMAALEYKIPEYSYTLSIPIVIKGLKSESDKEADEMYESLSRHDQKIVDNLANSSLFNDGLKEVGSLIKNEIPDIDKIDMGEREMTEEEKGRVIAILAEQMTIRLRKEGMSEEGIKKFNVLIKKSMIEEM